MGLIFKLEKEIVAFVENWQPGDSCCMKPIELEDLVLYHDTHNIANELEHVLIHFSYVSVRKVGREYLYLEIEESVLESRYASDMSEWAQGDSQLLEEWQKSRGVI